MSTKHMERIAEAPLPDCIIVRLRICVVLAVAFWSCAKEPSIDSREGGEDMKIPKVFLGSHVAGVHFVPYPVFLS